MSEETDMKCPYCGLELPGPPGQYNVCGHCRNKIFWMNGKPIKRPLLTDKPVVIEPQSPINYEPPKVPEEDLKRIEEEKKQEAQLELERLVRNALQEEKDAREKALREELKAEREARREEEEAEREARREELKAEREAQLKEYRARSKARLKEAKKLRSWHDFFRTMHPLFLFPSLIVLSWTVPILCLLLIFGVLGVLAYILDNFFPPYTLILLREPWVRLIVGSLLIFGVLRALAYIFQGKKKETARLREEKIKQSRKTNAEIFSFFVLLLILFSIPAFLRLILTALKRFLDSIPEFIENLLLL